MYCTKLYGTVMDNNELYFLYCNFSALHFPVVYVPVLHSPVFYFPVWYFTVLHYTLLCCTAMYCALIVCIPGNCCTFALTIDALRKKYKTENKKGLIEIKQLNKNKDEIT